MKQGWEVKTIENVCSFFGDGDWIESKDQSTDGVRLVQTGNVGAGFFKDRGEKARYVSQDTFERLRCTEIIEGDCLISRLPDPVGRGCILPNTGEKMITAVDCTIIRFDKNTILPNWFVLYTLSNEYQRQINSQVSGATRQRISRKNLGLIEIPLPPIKEQQRIVAILDEAFAAIAQAKANAEQNLKNAKELFESYLQSVFENKGEGWEDKTLGEVCNIIGGGTPSKANNNFYDGDIFWATVRDMKGEILNNTEHKITKDAVKNSSTNIIPKGNVVIATRVGLGKVCLIGNDTAINQDLRGVIPLNPNKLSVDFLYRWFKSIAHKIVEEGTGATVQGVKLPFIKSLVIFIPPIKEQQTIVQKLDALSTETKQLEAIYQQKINDLDELKKSILQKAFAGELNTASLVA